MTTRTISRALTWTWLVAGCASDELTVGDTEQALDGDAIGLAVEVDNGAGVPLSVKAGQTFYLNQIDLRASLDTDVDEGVAGLARAGDFADLVWGGVRKVDQEPVLLANADGTFTFRKFYREAQWMDVGSTFELEQIDANGAPTAPAVVVHTGVEFHEHASDDFFDRRFRAIQWTNDCKALFDCTGAKSFREEALVELRLALHPEQTFAIRPATAALRLTWSLKPRHPYTIPLTQVATPAYAYGFSIDTVPLTPPRADGTYAPGSDIEFQVTLRDGAGTPLHPPDTLPSYNDVIFGLDPAGIQYYRAFFDPTTTYYRRKHRERMMMSTFEGPAQSVQSIHTIIDLDKFLTPDDVQVTGTLANDGVHAEFHTFPTAHDLFGGAFDPTHAAWANPVATTWTHHIPSDAPAGTYYLTTKGRRVYLGEDIPFTRTIQVQVGTPEETKPVLGTGGCNSCHSGNSSLGNILHANADRGTCTGCHVPLGFELEGPIYVRVHFIHSRTDRLDAPLIDCANCHLTRASIQRTSKSACLSCHTSYPAWHVTAYGPVQSMYFGGGRESFEQCTTTCHRNHPASRL